MCKDFPSNLVKFHALCASVSKLTRLKSSVSVSTVDTISNLYIKCLIFFNFICINGFICTELVWYLWEFSLTTEALLLHMAGQKCLENVPCSRMSSSWRINGSACSVGLVLWSEFLKKILKDWFFFFYNCDLSLTYPGLILFPLWIFPCPYFAF